MREGRNAPLQIKIGKALIPCRILTGDEVVRIEQSVLVAAGKLKEDQPPTEQWHQHQVRKEFLIKATTIDETPGTGLTPILLSAMSNDEVLFAYRAYTELLGLISPVFETMTQEMYDTLEDDVKKNPALLSECTSGQLAAALAHVWELDLEALRRDRFSG